jgi:hypothetical protein
VYPSNTISPDKDPLNIRVWALEGSEVNLKVPVISPVDITLKALLVTSDIVGSETLESLIRHSFASGPVTDQMALPKA